MVAFYEAVDRRELTSGMEIVRSSDGRVLTTDSGIPLKAYYSQEDISRHPEPPGVFPFTRGISPSMYRAELWHIDMYAGFGSVEDSRERYEFLLEQGASGVNIALDLPTQLGLDSDDPLAKGEVGKVGLAVDSLQDLEDLFRNTRLDEAKIVFTVANGIGPLALAWFIALGERQGVPRSRYVVHLQNDPLKEYTGRGAFVLPLEPSIRLAADVVEYCVREGLRHWKPIGICGSQFRWGGGNAVHEVAFGICDAIAYIEELTRRGLHVDEFAPLLEMHLTADIDLFEEVAKFRAARRVWARLLRDRYGARDPDSWKLRISLYTAGYRLTRQEPLNNIVRTTIQALAAILGGVQHIGTLSFDEALSTPSEQAAKVALRTQQILAYEARVGHVVDPLGGSYLIERLTDEIEEEVWKHIREVERIGGAVNAIRSGYFQRHIDVGAYRFQTEIESGERVVVGVNRFVDNKEGVEGAVKPFRVPPEVEQRQIERLRSLRASRDQREVEEALRELREVVRRGENAVKPLIRAVKAYATVGEVYGVFRDLFGTYRDERILL
jgi:methylmalonyl-CoA mutase N-terminal domain/subunit